ncbi:MAG: hypothetical protein L0215_03100 [Gemmataceae bacterium]|nr:hypothetical protein [Gemmataceae bacterium]
MLFLLDVFVWYPNSPRGVFDRIEIGMEQAEVESLLAHLEDGKWQWPVFAVVWNAKTGRTVYDKQGDAEIQSILFQVGVTGLRHPLKWRIEKVTNSGMIAIDFDSEGRVASMYWFGFERQWPGFLERIRSWFGL